MAILLQQSKWIKTLKSSNHSTVDHRNVVERSCVTPMSFGVISYIILLWL